MRSLADCVSSIREFVDISVMACSNIVSTEDIGKFHELCPLNIAVALDAGIGREAFQICINKGIYDVFLKERSTVVRVVLDVQDLADAPCLVNLAAPAVPLFVRAPDTERNADDFHALLLQKISCNSAVYAT